MVSGKDSHPSLQGPRQDLTPDPVGPRQRSLQGPIVKHSHPGPEGSMQDLTPHMRAKVSNANLQYPREGPITFLSCLYKLID